MTSALITCHHLQRSFDRYRLQYERLGVTPILPTIEGQQLDALTMGEWIDGVDAVIAGDDVLDASVLERGQGSALKAVIKWGIGTDAIDTAAAARLGIPVFNTPGMFANEVADLAISHILMLARQAHRMHASIVNGGWDQTQGRTLAGLRAGIIGLGSIGSAIGRRALAFGMDVVGYDVRTVPAAELGASGVRQVTLAELIRRSDVIFLACQLTDDNFHLLDASAFAAMPDGVTVVNVSRGGLIDQGALVSALSSGKVAGAGLDVFEDEPLPADDPLRQFADRCTFTAHSGSNTGEAVERTNQATTDILLHVLGLKKRDDLVPNRVA